jgi:hypothetical protein
MNLKVDFTNPFFRAVMQDILAAYKEEEDNVVYMGKLFKIHGLIRWSFEETKGNMPKQPQMEYIFNLVDDVMIGKKDLYFTEEGIKIVEYHNERLEQHE